MCGASVSEARDLAPIMHIEGWFDLPAVKPSRQCLEAAGTWLMDWRAERKQMAREVRANRSRRIDAGYRSVPVEDPVIFNGETKW